MSSVAQTASNKKWEAEADARNLSESEVIRNDAKRYKAARIAAKRLSKEKTDEAVGMAKIAGEKYPFIEKKVEKLKKLEVLK